MDFERATIKTLFYDYPVEHAVKIIREGDKGYLDVFPLVARWRETAFSMSEMDALKRRIVDANKTDNAESILKTLATISAELLEVNKAKMPVVKYENLLRWQEISSFVGEDMLTIPYIAQYDKEASGKLRENFLWADILPHNNDEINKILDKGLTDVHAHFRASVDVFHLNWIAMMNTIHMSGLVELEKQIKAIQEQPIPLTRYQKADGVDYSIVNMIIAAAYIRVCLWNMVKGKDCRLELSSTKLEDILSDRVERVEVYNKTLSNAYKDYHIQVLRDNLREVIDYAIEDSEVNRTNEDNIYTIYVGERKLLYSLFYELLSGNDDIKKVAPYIYLYLLLKTHVRRIYVQNNHLVGFENFQIYEKLKGAAIASSSIKPHYAQYVLQTTVRHSTKDHLEGRLFYPDINDYEKFEERFINEFSCCNKSVYSKAELCSLASLSLVYHFIKSKDYKEGFKETPYKEDVVRHASFRQQLHTACGILLHWYKNQKSTWPPYADLPKLTGIDAAGCELYCRPEVFAHAFRYCRKKGLVNQTYHVGEDFLDLVDGLRAIDEVLRLLEFDNHCRLGHALALGTNALKYYESRHYHSLLPRQNHLDNCVWLIVYGARYCKYSVTKEIKKWLYQEAKREYEYLGYNTITTFSEETYWKSMLLRGADVDYVRGTAIGTGTTDWAITAIQSDEEIVHASHDEHAIAIYEMYHRNKNVKMKGIEVVDVKWHVDIVRLVKRIQKEMMHIIDSKQVAIECNPTSNYKIGHFERYDELPILQFMPLEEKRNVNATINTDDRGVFATSLSREFSLIGLALQKARTKRRKISENQILEYIERIRENGESQCFTLQRDEYEYYKQ